MRTLRILATAAAMMVSAAAPAAAGEVKAGSLAISKAWARATPPWPTATLGFLTIENGGAVDRLLSASSDIARQTQLHRVVVEDGKTSMRLQAKGVGIPAGSSFNMGTQGYHLMFLGLKQSLVAGETFTVTLTFENAGAVDLAFDVLSPQKLVRKK